MSFNSDPKQQAQEVVFSQRSEAIWHPSLVFNNNNGLQSVSQKYIGIS